MGGRIVERKSFSVALTERDGLRGRWSEPELWGNIEKFDGAVVFAVYMTASRHDATKVLQMRVELAEARNWLRGRLGDVDAAMRGVEGERDEDGVRSGEGVGHRAEVRGDPGREVGGPGEGARGDPAGVQGDGEGVPGPRGADAPPAVSRTEAAEVRGRASVPCALTSAASAELTSASAERRRF